MSGDVGVTDQTWGEFQAQCDALTRAILVLANEGAPSGDFRDAAVATATDVALLSHFIGWNGLGADEIAREWVTSGEFMRFASQIHEHLDGGDAVTQQRVEEIGNLARKTRRWLPKR